MFSQSETKDYLRAESDVEPIETPSSGEDTEVRSVCAGILVASELQVLRSCDDDVVNGTLFIDGECVTVDSGVNHTPYMAGGYHVEAYQRVIDRPSPHRHFGDVQLEQTELSALLSDLDSQWVNPE